MSVNEERTGMEKIRRTLEYIWDISFIVFVWLVAVYMFGEAGHEVQYLPEWVACFLFNKDIIEFEPNE